MCSYLKVVCDDRLQPFRAFVVRYLRERSARQEEYSFFPPSALISPPSRHPNEGLFLNVPDSRLDAFEAVALAPRIASWAIQNSIKTEEIYEL